MLSSQDIVVQVKDTEMIDMKQLDEKSAISSWSPYNDHSISGLEGKNMASYDRSRVRTPNEIRKEIDQDYIYHDVVFQKA